MTPAEWANIVLGVPVFGVLVILILLRKVVPGWSLDDQRAREEQHLADVKAGYERELASATQRAAEMRADLVAAAAELRETTPVLVRANDSLTTTRDLLQELLRRGTFRGQQ